jgi:hypothetical protein
MAEHRHAGRWALTIIVYIDLAVAEAIWGFKMFGKIAPQLGFVGKIAMIAAVGTIAVKLSINGLRRKEFKLHEQGQDVTLMTVGAAIPGAAAVAIKNGVDKSEWIWFAIAAFILMIVSALVAEAAEESSIVGGPPGKAKIAWTLANLMLGIGSFLLYMLIVVVKAQ